MTSLNLVTNFQKNMKGLLTEGTYSDVVLVVNNGEKEIPVHRYILACQSAFFHKMFYENQFMEAGQNKMAILAPLPAFEKVLKFMYCGVVDIESDDEALEVWELAHRYGLEELENSLVDKLVAMVKLENLMVMMKASELMNSQKLAKTCWDFVEKEGEKLLSSEAFLKFTANEVVQISPHLKMTNIKKFEAVKKWINANPGSQQSEKDLVLSIINFSVLTNAQLLKVVKPTGLIETDKILEILELRDKDVNDEVDPTETENLARNAKVIIGTTSESESGKKSIQAERINESWEIVIDLGSIVTFNFISFSSVATDEVYEILVTDKITPGIMSESGWKFVIGFKNNLGFQNVYLPITEARFIRFLGTKSCANLKIMNGLKPPRNFELFTDDCQEQNTNNNLLHATACLGFDPSTVESFKLSSFSLKYSQKLKRCRFILHNSNDVKEMLRFVGHNVHNELRYEGMSSNGFKIFDLYAKFYQRFYVSSDENKLVHFENKDLFQTLLQPTNNMYQLGTLRLIKK